MMMGRNLGDKNYRVPWEYGDIEHEGRCGERHDCGNPIKEKRHIVHMGWAGIAVETDARKKGVALWPQYMASLISRAPIKAYAEARHSPPGRNNTTAGTSIAIAILCAVGRRRTTALTPTPPRETERVLNRLTLIQKYKLTLTAPAQKQLPAPPAAVRRRLLPHACRGTIAATESDRHLRQSPG